MTLRKTPIQVEFDDSGIFVFESRHSPGFEMKIGDWDFDKICFVQHGSGVLITADSERTLQHVPITVDDVLYVPAGITHRFKDDAENPMTLIMICFYPDMLKAQPATHSALQIFSKSVGTAVPFQSTQTHRRTSIIALLRQMVFEQSTGRSGYSALLLGLLVQLLVILSRSKQDVSARGPLPPHNQAFVQTLDFLDESFTDPVQIKDLASMAGVSYRRYTTLFKQAKGETVNAYITRLRINYAKQRLGESGNVLLSALESGFGDLSHFYRVFKSETGLTPKQFIKDKTT